MPVPQRDWIDLVYAFAPAVAIFIALIIGGFQLYIQHKQQQQDLFDKRYRIYEATRKYLIEVCRRGADKDSLREFAASTSHARFLYGPAIVEELGLIEKRVNEIGELQVVVGEHRASYDGRFTEAELQENLLRITALTMNLETIMEGQGDLFHPYLQLHHDRWWLGRLFDRINRWMDSDIPAKLATRHDS